jgi:DNA-binding transcriptional ArsR family regulator
MSDEYDTSALRAIAHPLRLRMLSLLTGVELSAAEVARELDISHANASYHLRQLLHAGQLVVTGEEKIRGGVARRYRHDWHQQRIDDGPVSPDDRVLLVRACAAELVRRFDARAVGKGAFTDAELWVEQEVYDSARELVLRAAELLHAAARPPRTEGTIRMNLTAALFPMEPGRRDPA